MEISFAMLIFLLFLDQISGGTAKVSEGANCLGGGGGGAPICRNKYAVAYIFLQGNLNIAPL